MLEPENAAIFETLRSEMSEDAVITRDMITALERLVGGEESGFYGALGSIVGGVGALEQRVLDLERRIGPGN